MNRVLALQALDRSLVVEKPTEPPRPLGSNFSVCCGASCISYLC